MYSAKRHQGDECPYCGARLDSGEECDCLKEPAKPMGDAANISKDTKTNVVDFQLKERKEQV